METQAEPKQMSKADFYKRIFSAEGNEAKRNMLKSMSETAKMMMETNPDVGDRVNDVILENMYKSEEHNQFNTFKGWKEQGFKVIKGSKAFFIWSKPRKIDKKNEQEQSTDDDKKSYKMFGLAYLFSNAQVEPIEAPKN